MLKTIPTQIIEMSRIKLESAWLLIFLQHLLLCLFQRKGFNPFHQYVCQLYYQAKVEPSYFKNCSQILAFETILTISCNYVTTSKLSVLYEFKKGTSCSHFSQPALTLLSQSEFAYEPQLQSERKAYSAFTSITSQASSRLPGQPAQKGDP